MLLVKEIKLLLIKMLSIIIWDCHIYLNVKNIL